MKENGHLFCVLVRHIGANTEQKVVYVDKAMCRCSM